jgi:predicted transposase YdaD
MNKTQFILWKCSFKAMQKFIFVYFREYQAHNPWRGVVIYPSRSLDTAYNKDYSEFFTSQRVSRIYLNKLGESASLPIGIATIKLI